jgi:UDP-3-O-[3-hydroxymyristoyl] glucosamine N-acyltransferase
VSTIIGNNCAIHSSNYRVDGFGFAPNPDGTFKKSSNRECIIEDDVDIGACTTIDRATMGIYNYKKRN